MNKVGDRVGAILGRTEEGETKFLGYGVYEGEGVPIEAVGPIAEALVETKSTNPMIRLDSGSVVYGCECWWGPEDEVKRNLENIKVKKVDIDDVRLEYLENNKEADKDAETTE